MAPAPKRRGSRRGLTSRLSDGRQPQRPLWHSPLAQSVLATQCRWSSSCCDEFTGGVPPQPASTQSVNTIQRGFIGSAYTIRASSCGRSY